MSRVFALAINLINMTPQRRIGGKKENKSKENDKNSMR